MCHFLWVVTCLGGGGGGGGGWWILQGSVDAQLTTVYLRNNKDILVKTLHHLSRYNTRTNAENLKSLKQTNKQTNRNKPMRKWATTRRTTPVLNLWSNTKTVHITTKRMVNGSTDFQSWIQLSKRVILYKTIICRFRMADRKYPSAKELSPRGARLETQRRPYMRVPRLTWSLSGL